MITKQEHGTDTAQQVILYVKRNENDVIAYPLLRSDINLPLYEYRAEYSGSNVVYEGWAEWKEYGNGIAEEVWRIAKHTYSGSNKIQTVYAGTGEFKYRWDLRSDYFAAEGFLLLESADFILLEDGSKILLG